MAQFVAKFVNFKEELFIPMKILSIDSNVINDIAIRAGKTLLEYFNSQKDVAQRELVAPESKKRASEAFEAAYLLIVQEIEKAGYAYPVLSEEKGKIRHDTSKDWETYWVIDPLDDQQEYIEKHEDFAISIALIHEHYPVLGVIYLPIPDLLYFASGGNAYKCSTNHSPRKLQLPKQGDVTQLKAVIGRNMTTPKVEEVLSALKVTEVREIGSSLKFCMVAEAKADVFYREGEIMEWETAAGQAIVEMAGGKVLGANRQRLSYRYTETTFKEVICYGFQQPELHWL